MKITLSDARNKQNEFLNKLINIKIGRKTLKQEKTINNLKRFYISRAEVINFLKTLLKCYLMLVTNQSKIKLKENDLKY